MGLLNIIRRMHLRQKLSIREIARLTGLSREYGDQASGREHNRAKVRDAGTAKQA